MKNIKIVDYKSAYDELQQAEYDELYRLIRDFGDVVWENDESDKIIDQDPPVITVEIDGCYFYQDAKVCAAYLVDDEVVLNVLPQDSFETYQLRNIKDHVAYHQIYYISSCYADLLNSKDDNVR